MKTNYRVVHWVVYCQARICSDAFVDGHCYNYYLIRLLNRLHIYGARLHAYCFLPRQLYLLMTAGTPGSIDHLFKSLNSSYSDYFNIRFRRTGRVWSDSLHRLQPGNGQTLLDCQKYIERLPVKMLGYAHPGAHPWSSYCRNAFGRDEALALTAMVRRLKSGKRGSCARYRQFIADGFAPEYEDFLAVHIESGRDFPDKQLATLRLKACAS